MVYRYVCMYVYIDIKFLNKNILKIENTLIECM